MNLMNKKMILITALACLGGLERGMAEQPATDLSGEWYFDVLTSPNGPGRREVLFKQEGQRVIGFIESDSATGRFVGVLDGQTLRFTAVLEFGGQPMAADYEATVDAGGDRMSGTIGYGLYGDATFVGFRGRRSLDTSGQPGEIVGSAKDAGIDVARAGDFFGVMSAGVLLPEMLDVPGGKFMMGSDSPAVNPDYGKDFKHVHEVQVSRFRMSRFPVTNAQFLEFTEATGQEPPLPPKGWGDYLHRYPNHPVVNVNYFDAVAYTKWLSERTGDHYRLPTEAEWEYAARAGSEGQDYIFGNSWQVDGANTSVWYIGREVDRDEWKQWWEDEGERLSKSQPMTTRVGRFPPNAWGFYDLTGNVWEWTGDWYGADYYLHSPARDPKGPATGDEKALRGCSWYNKPEVCFLATRDRYAPEERLYYNGFRVVVE